MDEPTKTLLAAAEAARRHGRWQEAAESYRSAIAGAPCTKAWLGLALCLEELEGRQAARQTLLDCLSRYPDTTYAHFRLGWLAYQEGHFNQALTHYRNALTYATNWHEPAWHAAVCCHELRRYGEALSLYNQALRLKPNIGTLWYHYAKTLKDAGKLDAALPTYQKALELQPGDPEIRYSLGLLHLLRGDWLTGWDGYELRFQGSDRAATEHRPVTRLPRWQGEAVPGDSGIIVYAEQGMGDSIQCFRYAAALKANFARVKFSVQTPLVPLFQQCADEGVEIVSRVSGPIDETGYTHQVAMLSLPALLRTTPKNIPSAAYLSAEPKRQSYWQARLASDAGRKVGVVWQGGKITHAPARDMVFEQLQPLLARRDICWMSLQKDVPPPAEANVIDWMSEISDFADTAAFIANLHLVITVDTAVAHLAGAMGKPVWLLNRFESEWRWMRGQESSPWYPSMRIFNQTNPGDWASVIQKVSDALDAQFVFRSNLLERPMKTFLHIGCNRKRKDRTTRGFNTPEWGELRLDIDEKVKPDIVASMLDMAPVADGSMDAIYSAHNIEHLYPHEVLVALREFHRVLKADGFAVITCPDLQAVCALIAEDKLTETAYQSPAGPIAPIDILYGLRPQLAAGNLYMAHHCGFTKKSLTALLLEAGFPTMAVGRRGAPWFDLWAVANKTQIDEKSLRELALQHIPG